jgi:hypothetical protein
MSSASSNHKPAIAAGLFFVALVCVAVLAVIVVRGRSAQDSADSRGATTRASAAQALWSTDVSEADARRMFDEQVAAVRALRSPPVDPADNAATPLLAAGKYVAEHVSEAFGNVELSTRMSVEQWHVVDETLAENAAALALVDAAEGRTKADWGVQWKRPLIETLLPHLNHTRALANVLEAAALAAHRDGRDAEAVRRLSQILMLARTTEDRPFLVTHLVATGVARQAARRVAELAPRLAIGSHGPDGATTESLNTTAVSGHGAASPQQVRQLITALLADRWVTNGYRQAALMERLSFIDCVRELAADRISLAKLLSTPGMPDDPAALHPTPAKLFDDGRLLLPYLAAEVDAAGADRWPDYQRRVRRVPTELRDTTRHPIGGIVAAADRASIKGYQTVAQLRLAAVALASRLYAADHGGRVPPTLEEMVPAYLRDVPADPFAAEPALLLYLADPADPRVYSVGPNGIDDGGAPAAPAGGRAAGDDEVVHLKQPER